MDLYGRYIQFLIFLRKEAKKEEFRLAQNIFQQFGCRSRFKIPSTIFFQSSKTVQLSWNESSFKQKRRKLLNTSLSWIIWIYTLYTIFNIPSQGILKEEFRVIVILNASRPDTSYTTRDKGRILFLFIPRKPVLTEASFRVLCIVIAWSKKSARAREVSGLAAHLDPAKIQISRLHRANFFPSSPSLSLSIHTLVT